MMVEACAECGCALLDSAGRPITTRNCATCGRTRRAAQVEAAARELLGRLPRCRYDGLDVAEQCRKAATWLCFDLTCAEELRCDEHKYEHAAIGGPFDNAESRPTWWADAARRLGALLEGE